MHREIDFENDIEQVLLTEDGYVPLDAATYDSQRALFPQEVLAFVQKTQGKFWERLVALNKDKAPQVLIDNLCKELETKGLLATRKVVLDDEVELKYYRLQKVSEGSIDLKAGEPEPLYGPTDVGTGLADEDVQLSALVSKLNDRFGTDFTPADQLFFEQVRETAFENEALKQAAEANSIENFEPVFYKQLENLFVERMDGNEEIFVRLMNDDSFRSIAASHLMRAVYKQFQKARAHGRDASL